MPGLVGSPGRSKDLDKALAQFCNEFPPLTVYRREQTVEAYLAGDTDGTPNRAVVLEELLMLWVSNKNPALDPYLELFSDDRLARETAYPRVMHEIYKPFSTSSRALGRTTRTWWICCAPRPWPIRIR